MRYSTDFSYKKELGAVLTGFVKRDVKIRFLDTSKSNHMILKFITRSFNH